ncbi:MAG: hypothetical protein ACOH5I_09070 [Oligoflexus sp.]
MEKHQFNFVSFVIDDGVWGWDAQALEILGEAFQHAITNTIDHGFVFPSMKQPIVASELTIEQYACAICLASAGSQASLGVSTVRNSSIP